MTRINVDINPKSLIDEHLRAELREMPRIKSLVIKRIINNKAEVLNLFLKGKMPLKDLQDIATKDFGTDIATKAELEMFLKNKFMQDLMSDEHGIPVATLIKKIKELLKNI